MSLFGPGSCVSTQDIVAYSNRNKCHFFQHILLFSHRKCHISVLGAALPPQTLWHILRHILTQKNVTFSNTCCHFLTEKCHISVLGAALPPQTLWHILRHILTEKNVTFSNTCCHFLTEKCHISVLGAALPPQTLWHILRHILTEKNVTFSNTFCHFSQINVTFYNSFCHFLTNICHFFQLILPFCHRKMSLFSAGSCYFSLAWKLLIVSFCGGDVRGYTRYRDPNKTPLGTHALLALVAAFSREKQYGRLGAGRPF